MMKFVLFLTALASSYQVESKTNPIQKVLTLLSDLQKKVVLDGEIEEKQYEKFLDFCKDDATTKQYAIKNGKAKVEDLKAVIEKSAAEIMNADSTIADLAKTVTTNQKDLAAAQQVRDNERSDYEAADKELDDTIDMIGRAIGIIEKELRGGSFAQVSKTNIKDLTDSLNVVLQASVFSTDDQSKLQALLQEADDGDDFLSHAAPDAAAYESKSGGIVDTLEDMKEKATAMRNDGQKAELNAKHAFEMLAQSLNAALKVDGKALNEAKGEKALASEVKATAEGDLSMQEKTLAENQKALKLLGEDCQSKAADHETSVKSRAEELEALTQARKIIAEKTGGAENQAYGFLETKSSTASKIISNKIIKALKDLGKKSDDVSLTQLALRASAAFEMSSGDDVFAKVRGMITEMMDKLIAEAGEEASHKAWCDEQMGETQEKIEDHNRAVEKLSTKIDKAEAAIAQLKESVAQLQKELAELAKQQAKMNEIRAAQKEEFAQAKTDFTNGIDGLTMALQLLRDYYATPASDDAFVQAPTTSTHSASGDAATGIIGLLEVAQSDFSKMLADAEADEHASQEMYDKMTHENDVANAMKGADVKYQQKEQAGLETSVADLKEDRDGEQAELDAVTEYFAKVKPGCTVVPMTYEERKARRESEIDGLKEALTILEGETPQAFLAVARKHS